MRISALRLLVIICTLAPSLRAGDAAAVARGRDFLAGLFNPELGLLPEYPGAQVYWLYHDNYLAAKVLAATRPDLARRINEAIRAHGITRSGKIEILFGEAEHPLPFRHYELRDLTKIGPAIIRTEVVTDKPNPN